MEGGGVPPGNRREANIIGSGSAGVWAGEERRRKEGEFGRRVDVPANRCEGVRCPGPRAGSVDLVRVLSCLSEMLMSS